MITKRILLKEFFKKKILKKKVEDNKAWKITHHAKILRLIFSLLFLVVLRKAKIPKVLP